MIEPGESEFQTTKLTLFCEITEPRGELVDDASEYTEITVYSDDQLLDDASQYTEVTVGSEGETPDFSEASNEHAVISGIENLMRRADDAT